MALTSAQKTTLKTHIDTSPDLSIYPNNTDGNAAVTHLLNLQAAPAFTVWRSSVLWDTVMLVMDWARVDNLSVGKARIWDWMFDNAGRVIAPAQANIRAGIDAVWVGTQADLDVRAAVYAQCKRLASRVEQVLVASGTGSDSSPATMGFEGPISSADVEAARNS